MKTINSKLFIILFALFAAPVSPVCAMESKILRNEIVIVKAEILELEKDEQRLERQWMSFGSKFNDIGFKISEKLSLGISLQNHVVQRLVSDQKKKRIIRDSSKQFLKETRKKLKELREELWVAEKKLQNCKDKKRFLKNKKKKKKKIDGFIGQYLRNQKSMKWLGCRYEKLKKVDVLYLPCFYQCGTTDYKQEYKKGKKGNKGNKEWSIGGWMTCGPHSVENSGILARETSLFKTIKVLTDKKARKKKIRGFVKFIDEQRKERDWINQGEVEKLIRQDNKTPKKLSWNVKVEGSCGIYRAIVSGGSVSRQQGLSISIEKYFKDAFAGVEMLKIDYKNKKTGLKCSRYAPKIIFGENCMLDIVKRFKKTGKPEVFILNVGSHWIAARVERRPNGRIGVIFVNSLHPDPSKGYNSYDTIAGYFGKYFG